MAVEIGSLIVRGAFGPSASEDEDEGRMRVAIARMRREILDDVQEMLHEAERRNRER